MLLRFLSFFPLSAIDFWELKKFTDGCTVKFWVSGILELEVSFRCVEVQKSTREYSNGLDLTLFQLGRDNV